MYSFYGDLKSNFNVILQLKKEEEKKTWSFPREYSLWWVINIREIAHNGYKLRYACTSNEKFNRS